MQDSFLWHNKKLSDIVKYEHLWGDIWLSVFNRDRHSAASVFCHVTTTIGSAKAFWYSVSEHLSNMWLSILEIGAAQLLSVTEIASPLLLKVGKLSGIQ